MRLVRADGGVEAGAHQFGHPQPERTGQLTDDHLGDEGLEPLRGGGELDDIRAEVVRLDETGDGAAGVEGAR